MNIKLLVIVMITTASLTAQTQFEKINNQIEKGNYSEATQMIEEKLIEDSNNLSELEKYNLKFQIDRMERIRKDFTKTKDDILEYVRKYYPDAGERDLRKWEKSGALEYKFIDGKKYYFNRAAANIFRVDREAKKQKRKVEGETVDELDKFLADYLPKVVKESESKNEPFVKPAKLKLNYKLSVNPNAVPEGEVVRCWLPFPRKGEDRQRNIELLTTNVDEYVISDNEHPHRTLYMEKTAQKDQPTVFEFSVSYTGYNEYHEIDPDKVQSYNKNSEEYKKYTSEREPHIVFTDEIKKLSQEIIGDETNPYLQAKKIFTWISENIPWAGAREYSTIQNISDYSISTGHGDCGIKTITFMTLCRYNGIPTRWQSGWMLHPGEVNLHDWGQVYFEGYGWVPVDQSFGLQNSENEKVKYFYLGGLDAYRFIVNDDYSQPIFPLKVYPRSETVDFQRGEVEWKGGNLYFDQWDYHMDVEYLDN